MIIKKDLFISMLSANILSLAFALPIGIALVWLYIFRWDAARLLAGVQSFFDNLLVFLLVFIAGIIIHELIHGFTWAIFARKPFNEVKFGFHIQTLTPYAHLTKPVPVSAYRLGTLMPGFIIGILPAVGGIISGSGWLLIFGLLFTVAAGGDMVILWILRSVPPDKLVEDHPTRAGCFVLE